MQQKSERVINSKCICTASQSENNHVHCQKGCPPKNILHESASIQSEALFTCQTDLIASCLMLHRSGNIKLKENKRRHAAKCNTSPQPPRAQTGGSEAISVHIIFVLIFNYLSNQSLLVELTCQSKVSVAFTEKANCTLRGFESLLPCCWNHFLELLKICSVSLIVVCLYLLDDKSQRTFSKHIIIDMDDIFRGILSGVRAVMRRNLCFGLVCFLCRCCCCSVFPRRCSAALIVTSLFDVNNIMCHYANVHLWMLLPYNSVRGFVNSSSQEENASIFINLVRCGVRKYFLN